MPKLPSKLLCGGFATRPSGSLVDVEVQITAQHQGFFQFKLCELGENMATKDEECFDRDDSIVPFADGSTIYSITDVFPESSSSRNSGFWYPMQIKLPDQFECDHCVLQWRYHTGDSTDENGTGIGFGYQEELYGCADIKITSTSLPSQSTTNKRRGTTSTSSTTLKITSKSPTI